MALVVLAALTVPDRLINDRQASASSTKKGRPVGRPFVAAYRFPGFSLRPLLSLIDIDRTRGRRADGVAGVADALDCQDRRGHGQVACRD